MEDESLEAELLKAVRSAPGRGANELAQILGMPRTNFGRPMGHQLRQPLDQLQDEGLVEEHGGRYRLTEAGRRRLAHRAVDST